MAGARADARRDCAARLRRHHAGAARRAAGRGARASAATTSASSRHCGRSWSYRDADGTLLGQKVTPLDRVGIYVPGGKAAYPSIRADERDAGPGRRRRRDRDGGADARRRAEPAGARRGRTSPAWTACSRSAARRRWRRWPTARRPMPARRQDHRPRQRLRGQRQAARVRHGRHRHDRRPERDPGAGRRHDAARLGGDGPVLARPSTTNWRRASCCAPTRPTSTRCARRSTGCCRRMPRARRDPRLARRPRRADPDARRWTRPARSATASRPSTSRSARATRSAGSRCCATPARSSSARYTSESLGDYCAGPNHVLPTSGTARFSSPLGVYDFQKRSSLIEVSQAGAQALGPIAAELAHGEGLQAHARAAEMRLERRRPPMSEPTTPARTHPRA